MTDADVSFIIHTGFGGRRRQHSAEFMKKTGNSYIWPDIQDIAFQPCEDVICAVQPPILKNERSHFEFSVEDIMEVRRKKVAEAPKSVLYFK